MVTPRSGLSQGSNVQYQKILLRPFCFECLSTDL